MRAMSAWNFGRATLRTPTHNGLIDLNASPFVIPVLMDVN